MNPRFICCEDGTLVNVGNAFYITSLDTTQSMTGTQIVAVYPNSGSDTGLIDYIIADTVHSNDVLTEIRKWLMTVPADTVLDIALVVSEIENRQ